MRGVVVLLLFWSRLAAADDPSGLTLEKDPVEMVRGHLEVRLVRESTVEKNGDNAVFDWGTARLYLKAYATELVGDAGFKKAIIDDLAKQAPRIAGARVEPLTLAKPLVGYSVTPRTRAREDELVYAAYIAGADNAVDVLAFYVDVGGLAKQSGWIDVAKRVAAATSAPPTSPLEKTKIGSLTISLPHGTRLRSFDDVHNFFEVSRAGSCSIAEDGSTSQVPDDAKQAPGHVLGKRVDWQVWKDRPTWWETVNVDTVHILCSGTDARSLARMRGIAESLAR